MSFPFPLPYSSIRRKKRARPRRGEPSPKEKTVLRWQVYQRAEGRCELNLSKDCVQGVLEWTGPDPWSHGHLVHLRSRGAGGDWTVENCRWGCFQCHLGAMHTEGKKPE